MARRPQNRDLIVVGSSAGGVQALSKLVAGLPADLPASVLVVVHTASGRESPLPDILTHRGPLRATHPVHGEQLLPGRIYVAPPDNHLMVRPGYLHVVRGPKENGHRPSVDVLFRTAAAAYGPRVIGVVLTGFLDCGTAGMMSVRARGGLGVVQDPADAAAPDMPRSVIQHVGADHVVPLEELPDLIARLAREPADEGGTFRAGAVSELEGDEPGIPADIVCPLCQGALTFSEHQGFQLFRCHVGHAFSLESLAVEQADALERALWAAARALEESATVLRRAGAAASGDLRARLADKEEAQAQHAQLIRQILLSRDVLTRSDAPSASDASDVPTSQH